MQPAQGKCPGPIVFQQYLQELTSEISAATSPPVPLSVSIEPLLYPVGQQVKEKNWMPFVYRGRLFVVHSLHPTRVFQLDRLSGKSLVGYTTSAEALYLKNRLPADKLHGGPPLALISMTQGMHRLGRVDNASSTRPGHSSYYLGVLHYYDLELTKLVYTYHHHFFMMQARPPFQICTLSKEITLQSVPKAGLQKQNVHYISGLDYDKKNDTVLVSYGAADTESRLLVMSMHEVQGLFINQASVCWHHATDS